ncbi:head decoration protein [Pararhodobacter zhoushanensis]|uniref:head decoration protein n=1 Tax=Pararhodobacter zhoushanensis TaxID=2479545 RepID=UPI000F8E2D70|nr:head decoration protein [Pararhodobacter zhoushanensis]
MTVLTQPAMMGDVLKYEVNPNYTRETVTLLAGTAYSVGSVLGRITASGKYTLSPETGSDGSETALGVLLYAVDATLSDAIGLLLARGPAIVSRAALAFDSSVDDPAKIAVKVGQLTALGIIPRDTA